MIGENTVLQKTFARILGCALFLYGSTALAFTLITITPPSNTVTDATTQQTEIQPIASAIRAQLFSLHRLKRSARVTEAGRVLVASADRSGGFGLLAANDDRSGAGGGSLGGGNTESLWISSTANSLENDFSRTAFHGATHNLVAGFDVTRSDRYVLGISAGHEASNYVTTFNAGNQKARGFNVSPYFAYLLSDTWSVDLILGYGEIDTRQSRTLGTGLFSTIAVDSEFSSMRGFVSTNLTNVSTWGNWNLTGALGLLASRREQDAYTESALGTTVAGSKQSIEQWNLSGEAAYGRGASETYLGLLYEKTRDPLKVEFASGEQPANDPDSVLLTAGWRHFGKGLTANFVFSKRLAQDQVNEYGFSMMIRVDL
jgi:hypothetical protein